MLNDEKQKIEFKEIVSILIFFYIFFFSQFISAEYVLQIGAFKNKNNAENLIKELKEKGYIARLVESGDGFFRVWIGKFSKEEDAKKEKEKIEESGYPVIVKKIDSEKKLKETEVKIVVKEQAKRKQVISKKSEEKSETSYSQIFVKNFSDHKSAENLRNELSKKGYFSYILVVKNNYKVMVGKTSQESLEEIVERLKKDGYPAILVP